MPKSLVDDLRSNVKKQFNSSAWVLLCEIQINDTQSFYLTNNVDEVTSDGDLYDPFPISLSGITDGETIDSTDVVVGNISRELASSIDSGNGLSGRYIFLHLVNLADLDNKITERVIINTTKVTQETVVFSCTKFTMEGVRFPNSVYLRQHCRWEFTSTECGVDSSVPSEGQVCTKKLDGDFGCSDWGDREVAAGEARLHPQRYGAFPSIPRGFNV